MSTTEHPRGRQVPAALRSPDARALPALRAPGTLRSPAALRSARALVALAVSLLTALTLLAAPARAGSEHVVDEVGRLSAAQKQELENRIATVSATYGQDIVVLLAELGGKTPMARADDYFDDHGYGLGPERSGVLLLIAPGSRDWWISTRGTSITTFTDAGIQALGTRLKEPLGKSDWNGAATLFVQQCDRYMKAARAGSPITHAPLTARQKTLHWLGAGGGVLLGGVGPGWMIVQLVFVRRMRNEGLEPDARSYVTPGSLAITGRQDRFVTKYVTRTKRESSSSSSSSSDSSTHTSSSGATHGGGGGSF